MKKDETNIYRTAVEASLDAVISVNEEGRIILWNPAAERMLGYGESEAVGSLVEVIVPPELRERHREGMKRFLSTGESAIIGRTVELVAMRKDGSRVPVELSLSAERSGGRWVFTGIVRDISDRKRLEGELRERLTEMERLNKLMVGRELKMEELRREIRELRARVK